ELAGLGNNTLQGFTAYITNSDTVITNLTSTPGNDTIIAEPLPMDPMHPENAGFASYEVATAAIVLDLAAGTVTGGAGSDTLAGGLGAPGRGLDDTMSGDKKGN